MTLKRNIVNLFFALAFLTGSVANVLASYCPHAQTEISTDMHAGMGHHAMVDHASMNHSNDVPLETCDVGMACTYHVTSSLLTTTLLPDILEKSPHRFNKSLTPRAYALEHTPPPPRT